MKIIILLLAATLVVANPSKQIYDCREPEDYRKCEIRCKFRGFGGSTCDELSGCKCYHVPDKIDDRDKNFKCLTTPDREWCENYCRRKGFITFACDLETVCSCYDDKVPYINDDGSTEGGGPISENDEEVLSDDPGHFEDKPQIQCNPQFDGDRRCYSYCKNLGMRNGKCQYDGQCNCFNMDIEKIFDDKLQRCLPRYCDTLCKKSGSDYGKCEVDGECHCYDDDFSPY